MADVTMTLIEPTKSGVLDLAGHADVEAGNAAGGSDWYMPNDGNVVLVFIADGAGGDTVTITAVADKYGRTETLAPVVASGKTAIIGPFMPELWNSSPGLLKFSLTSENAADVLAAVKIANPS